MKTTNVDKKKRGLPKGRTNNPNGRVKGTANKATTHAREAIAAFVDGNAHRLVKWLDRMGEDDPEAAFRAYMSVVEYHIPKLARSEHVGDNEKPIAFTVKWGE